MKKSRKANHVQNEFFEYHFGVRLNQDLREQPFSPLWRQETSGHVVGTLMVTTHPHKRLTKHESFKPMRLRADFEQRDRARA